MKEIPLTQGKVALVDDEDYERVAQFKWFARRANHGVGTNWYAARMRREDDKGSSLLVFMHRFILAVDGLSFEIVQADHRDGDGLNNRRQNLRLCAPVQNRLNRPLYANNKSGLKGVRLAPDAKSWISKIRINGKLQHLGHFRTAVDAALAYDIAAFAARGEFAHLNFSQEAVMSCKPERLPRKLGVSGIRGIALRGGKWVAQACPGNGKKLHLGTFDSKEEAMDVLEQYNRGLFA